MKKSNISKKIVSLTLCISLLSMAFSLVSCAENNTENKKDPSSTTPQGTNASSDTNTKDFMKGKLRLIGPGWPTAETDEVDPVTKQSKTGFHVVKEAFKKLYPDVELEIESIPWDSWQAKLQTAAAGGLADILVHGSSMTDVVEDLTPYIAKDSDITDKLYLPTALRRSDETNYTKLTPMGLSISMNANMIMFDKQLFDDFGVPYLTKEHTWNDLLEVSKKLTGKNPKTGKDCYGIFISNTASNVWPPYMGYMRAKDIHSIEFKDNKFESELKFNTPEVIGTFSFFKEMSACFPKGFLEMAALENFGTAENDTAIIFGDPAAAHNRSVALGTEARYGYATMPKLEKSTGYAVYAGDWNMAIAKTSQNKDVAWEFLKWMATDDTVADYLIETGKIPNSRPGMEKLIKTGVPYADILSISYDDYPKDFFFASSEYYDNIFGTMESSFVNNVTSMYSGAVTPEQCAQQIQNEMEEYRKANQ